LLDVRVRGQGFGYATLTVGGYFAFPFSPVYEFGIRRPEASCQHPRSGQVRLGHQHGELLSAQTAEQVAVPDLSAENLGGPAEHLVSGMVSEGVVHPLEMVDVQHHHRQRLPVAPGPGELPLRLLVEKRPVAGSGHARPCRLPFQLLAQFLLLGDIQERGDHAGHLARLVPLHRPAEDHIPDPSAPVHHGGFEGAGTRDAPSMSRSL
jgi:hypothetical protein